MLKIFWIEILYIILPFIYLSLSCYGVINQFMEISSDYRTNLHSYHYITEHVLLSLEPYGISNFLATPAQKPCPLTYDTLLLGQWPGNYAGCYNHVTEEILDKDCSNYSFKDDKDKWAPIPSQLPKSLAFWNGYKFCAQLNVYPMVNFTTGSCNPGYKSCSNGLLCVRSEKDCPLTSIEMKWSPNGEEIDIRTSHDPNQNAILYLSTSVNGMPCVNPLHSPMLQSLPTYPLSLKKPVGCDQLGVETTFAKEIGKQSLFQFYFGNNIKEALTKLPNYANYLGGSSATLYYKTKIAVNIVPECKGLKHIMKTIHHGLKEFSFSGGLISILVVYNVIATVFGMLTFLFLCFNKESEGRERYIKEQKCLLHILHFMPYVLCALYIAQSTEIPENGGKFPGALMESLNLILSNNCFPNHYGSVYAQLKEDIIEMKNSYGQTTKLMGTLSYISLILLLIVRFLRGYYKKEMEKFEKEFFQSRFVPLDPIENLQLQNEMSLAVAFNNEHDEGV